MNTVPRKFKVKPKRVDFMNNHDDHQCALLAAMGMSTAYIADKTGLTHCQITYRIRHAGLTSDNDASRLDFRNGKSPFTRLVLSAAKTFVDADLKRFLRRNAL